MDEEQQEQEEQSIAKEKMENAAKNAAKDASRKVAKAAGKALKELAITIIKAIGIKGMIIVAIVIIVIILLAAFFFHIGKATFNSSSSALERASLASSQNDTNGQQYQSKHANVIGIVNINEVDRSLNLNTADFEEMMTKWFEENSINPRNLGISEDYREFKTFIQAEVSTLYPDFRTRDLIGTEVPEGQIQGCIQFHRKFEDGTSQILEYMPYEQYAIEVAKLGLKLDDTITQQQIYTSRADVEAQYDYIKNYFTLDANLNLVIARLTSSETVVTYDGWADEENRQYRDGTEYNYTFKVEKELINYQSAVEDYAMPFEFCVALLITTQNPEFCMEVANLAKNSSIIVEVLDNATTSVDTTVFGYSSHFSLREDVTYYTETADEDEQGNPTGTTTKKGPYHTSDSTSDTHTTTEYETIVTTRYSIIVQPQVTVAETWLASINIAYSNTTKTEQVTPTVSEWEPNDGASHSVPKYHNSLRYPNISEGSNWVDVDRSYTTLETRSNKTTTFTTQTTTNTYNEVSRLVKETPDKFLSLLKIDPKTGKFDLYNLGNNTEILKYKNIENRLEAPEENLLNAKEFLFDLLSSNTKTANAKLDETMKYLLDLYTGQVTVDENRFTIYNPGDFRSMVRRGSRRGYYGGLGIVFGCNISRDEFINCVRNYRSDATYQTYMAKYAEDFYDVCNSNGINPIFAFAHSCLETGYGSVVPYNNYFGYATYNGNSHGSKYTTPAESIQAYCNWIEENAHGSSANYNNARAMELAPYAQELEGTADSNVYVLFCRYAQLDGTHDASSGIGNPREFMRIVHGGACDHASGSPTTTEEKALYAVYSTGQRIKIAENIFGDYAKFTSSGGGEYVTSSDWAITGYFTSYITGRTHAICQQWVIPGWGGLCNRGAVANICSAYYDGSHQSLFDLMNYYNTSNGGHTCYNQTLFNDFGLTLPTPGTYHNTYPGDHSVSADVMREQLLKGNYVLVWVGNGKPTTSKYGVKWTGSIHWLSVLGYRVEDDQEEIFIGDCGSTLRTGWHPIDEFDGMVDHYVLVNQI